MRRILLSTFATTLAVPTVYAYWENGHAMVAAIAEMHVHPSAMRNICDILDAVPDLECGAELEATGCHLSTIASWADCIKELPNKPWKWANNLHFGEPVDDFPAKHCPFPGPNLWVGKPGINVFDGIKNVTGVLQAWAPPRREVGDAAASEALRFLVHFLGDIHQPLHLTGRALGGNTIKVKWNGSSEEMNLHKVWDGKIIEKIISQTIDDPELNKPLPNKSMEAALIGSEFDTFVRRIILEGVSNEWSHDIQSWLDCPSTPLDPNVPTLAANPIHGLFGAGFLSSMVEVTYRALQRVISSDSSMREPGVELQRDTPQVCPYYWAKPTHELNCEIAWPKWLDDQGKTHGDHDLAFEFADEVIEKRIIDKLVAQGGIRLAGILNYIFADAKFKSHDGLFLG